MPIATPETYRAMLDAARAGGYALPAINVTSSETISAALGGFVATVLFRPPMSPAADKQIAG